MLLRLKKIDVLRSLECFLGILAENGLKIGLFTYTSRIPDFLTTIDGQNMEQQRTCRLVFLFK
jgi:hypothetical protein